MESPPLFLQDRSLCRSTINKLKTGTPPSHGEIIQYLYVGRESHLERIKKGFDAAKSGNYDVILVEGGYGKGKSHLIEYINILALEQKFMVKRLEVGSGDLFFHRPDDIIGCIIGDDDPISRKDYSDFNRRYYTYYKGNQFGKFCVGLQILADRSRERGKKGLVLLIDELEQTFDPKNLARFSSRVNAYKVLDIFFNGRYKWHDENDIIRRVELKEIFIVMAITPNTINEARNDSPSSWYSDNEYYNPAEGWKLPDFVNLTQLTSDEAFSLAKKIQKIHDVAFDWKSEKFLKNKEITSMCEEWSTSPVRNDERALVKQIIDRLEILEQNQ